MQVTIDLASNLVSVGELSLSRDKLMKLLDDTRVNVDPQESTGSSHFVSKLAQIIKYFGVPTRLQNILTRGCLPQKRS